LWPRRAALDFEPVTASVSGLLGEQGAAIIVLYLAVSLGFQRVLVMQPAHRLQAANTAAVGKVGSPG
jgi:hypothetical protein